MTITYFSRQYPYVFIASITTILAGILHATTVAFEHVDVPPEFWFFIVSGIAQIIWGVNYFYHRTSNMYFVGAVLNLGLTFFWLSVRLFPAPFSDAPETIGTIGIVTALVQLVAFGASFWSLYRHGITTVKSVVVLLALSIVLGWIGYATAKVSEDMLLQIWPDMENAPHGHGEEETMSGTHPDDDLADHEEDEDDH
tara:strand:+ start:1233 stop:1823 length:591 start_codon:yes stop_codon:yes gene_type:complete